MERKKGHLMKVTEVAEVLRIGRTKAYELVGSGEIPSIKVGRNLRVRREDLDRYIEERRGRGIGPE